MNWSALVSLYHFCVITHSIITTSSAIYYNKQINHRCRSCNTWPALPRLLSLLRPSPSCRQSSGWLDKRWERKLYVNHQPFLLRKLVCEEWNLRRPKVLLSQYTPCPPPGWLLIVRAVAQHVWHPRHVPPRQLCSYGHHLWLSSSLLCCSEKVVLDWFIQYDWAFCRELEVKNSNEARTSEVIEDMKPKDLLSTEWINLTDMGTIV